MIQTPYSTWNPEWSPTEHEIFRDFGFIALSAQMLESSIMTTLLVAEDAGKIEIKKPKRKEELESEIYLSERTMGQLFHIFREGGIDEKLTDLIDDALKARNYLMHNFFVWNSENYITEEGRGKMLKELAQLRLRIVRAQIAFDQIREQLIKHVYGYNAEDMQRLYNEFLNERKKR